MTLYAITYAILNIKEDLCFGIKETIFPCITYLFYKGNRKYFSKFPLNYI